MAYPHRRLALTAHALAALFVAGLLMAWSAARQPAPQAPRSDARIYVRLALGLSEFGVLGLYVNAEQPPVPAAEVTPVYPSFVAVLLRADEGLRRSALCALAAPDEGACPHEYRLLVLAQASSLSLFLFFVWATVYVWTGRSATAWLGLAAAWASGTLAEYTHVFLTEAVSLPLFGLLTLCLALVIRRRRAGVAATAAGLALGLLVLTRPSFWYLLLALLGTLAILAVVPPLRRTAARPWANACLVCLLVVSPWLARNYLQFGAPQVSAGDYGVRTLAQRVSYNDMSAGEFMAAFIFWLPDFGDTLARATLAPERYRRLGWDAGSFYQAGRTELSARSGLVQQDPAAELRRLVRYEILGRPLEHAMATMALAWRGMFIGKYWGILGWICAASLLVQRARARDPAFLLLCLPALFMLLFHAAASVSIPRYNLTLVPVLSLAIATECSRWYGGLVAAIGRHRART